MTTVAVLTGGGDCPGLNAVIRAVVRAGARYGYSTLGIRNGWKGLVEGDVEPLTDYSVSGILTRGGTILGTSRTNPFKKEADVQRLMDNIERFGIDALIVIGGDDTLSVADRLWEKGVPVIGIPKTIDNDLAGTDLTFGFDTAVSIVTEAIDRLHSTAESHHRIMVVEVMGRHAGWIATWSGIAGGADEILIPEIPFDIDDTCRRLTARYESGKKFSIVVVAEGAVPKESGSRVTSSDAKDEFGHERLGGIGAVLGRELEARLGVETRVTVLGHVQRGGTPTAFDRILATRFGVAAVELVHEGRFGTMAALKGSHIEAIPLKEATEKTKTVDMDLYALATIFFGG